MKEIVKGVTARLKAYSGVTNLVSTRTYLDVPQGATFPYISLDFSGENQYTKTDKGVLYRIIVNAWSRDKSPAEALDILAQVKVAIDRNESNITLDSGRLVMLEFVSEDCFKDPDGVTWHGVGIYNAYIDFGV